MKILTASINKKDLLNSEFVHLGPMVKGVVDVRQELLAIDSQMHADLEALFLENGSNQSDLWGINLYPEDDDENFLEFDSLINIRPNQGNPSRSVEDPETQAQIKKVVAKWILP